MGLSSRFMHGFFMALALAASGCSSNNNTADAAPVEDAGEDVLDEPKDLAGQGTVHVTWTVNGMPAADGCAAMSAQSVGLQVYIGSPVDVPCTDGTYTATDIPASQLTVSAKLKGAGGSTILDYGETIQVRPRQTTDVNIDFSPTGSLRVRWTINGMAASAECARVNGFAVVLTGQRNHGRSLSTSSMVCAPGSTNCGYTCRAGSYNFGAVQPGTYNVEGRLFVGTQSMNRSVSSAMGTAEITPGNAGEVVLDLTAPEVPMDAGM